MGKHSVDTSGNNHPAAVCSWSAGYRSKAGTNCATIQSPIRTDASFTVSAWVYLDLGSGDAVALAQDAYFLMYEADSGRWLMRMPLGDGNSVAVCAYADGQAVAGRWTHLMGTFDASARQVTIFVDGRRAGVASHPGMPWRAAGNLSIGHSLDSPAWRGSIDDVHLFTSTPPFDS